MKENFNIAIDGPAGAGKSTIARKVARTLDFVYVDTGAMYRAAALYMLRSGLSKPAEDVAESFRQEVCSRLKDADIRLEYQNGQQVVLLNGENVNPYIRTEEVSNMASIVSAIPQVREEMVRLQQKIASSGNVVMDGRDIGTVVLPDAQIKVFLTASVEVRARRRYLENLEKRKAGMQVSSEDLDLEAIAKDIAERDYRDTHREKGPLVQASDAVLIDSSEMSISQVAEAILNLYADKKGRPRVITARTAGFCFGVKRAVDAVYNEAENGSPIYTYGPIIHNEVVVEDLRRKGVDVIHTPEELEGRKDATIVIRSHGVTKELQQKIEASCARCIDTTCTFVKRIHEIVEKESAAGKKIIIIGNHGHAEAEGHVGWSKTPATIIENEQEAECFDGDKNIPLCVVAQTTFNGNKFSELVDILKQRQYNVTVNNTICNATRERQTEAGEIASKADIMIVIGGKSSSNTAKLYEICKEVCDRTYLIQTAEDLDLHLNGSEKLIGITAGASTPNNIIEEVQKDVRRTDF